MGLVANLAKRYADGLLLDAALLNDEATRHRIVGGDNEADRLDERARKMRVRALNIFHKFVDKEAPTL